jgi:tRNA threonylcarbamoyladenosine biosynthesis protein TsaE
MPETETKQTKDMPELALALASRAETERAAAILAGLSRRRDILALWGDLGAGKTTFARGFIAALSPETGEVPSPTFTLVQTYPARIGTDEVEIWHFDLYRLKQPQEAYELAIEEAFATGIALIEWPENLGGLLPPLQSKGRLDVRLEPGPTSDSRRLTLRAGPDWAPRLANFRERWAA